MKTIKLMAILTLMSVMAQAQQTYGEVRGTLKNELKEKVPFATVKILQDDRLVGGTTSDEEGNYKYKPLEPGTYDIIVMESGHRTKKLQGIKIIPGEASYVNIKMASNTFTDEVVVEGKMKVEDYTNTGVATNMYSMKSLDATEYMQNASLDRTSLMSVVTTMASDVLESPDGGFHFRGGRSDANSVYIDGVKTLDMGSLPALGVENITVFTGGVPAMYGDVTGGVVIVTTKSYFSGIREKNMRNRRINEKRQEKKDRQEEEKEKTTGTSYQ